MKKLIALLAVVLALASCYWQPADPPILQVEYAGLFVSTVTNQTTGAAMIAFGYQQQTIDTAEAFPGQDIFAVTASVEKGSFGDYVDLGSLTAQMGGQVDVAQFGDPRADLSWSD